MLGTLHIVRQLLAALDGAQTGVGLRPGVRVCPLRPIIQGVQHRQQMGVRHRPHSHRAGVLVHIIVDALPGKPGSGDGAKDGLLARLHALLGHVVQVAILLGMKLITGAVV